MSVIYSSTPFSRNITTSHWSNHGPWRRATSLGFTREFGPGCGISSIIDSVFADGGDDAIDHCTWEFNGICGGWTLDRRLPPVSPGGWGCDIEKNPSEFWKTTRWWPIGSAPCVDSFLSTWRCSGLWTLSFGGAICGFVAYQRLSWRYILGVAPSR